MIIKIEYLTILGFIIFLSSCKDLKKEYYENGNIKLEAQIINDSVLHGFYKTYYSNGNIKSINKYENGKKEGEYILYYKEGQIQKKTSYIDDKIDGTIEIYYIDGNLKYIGFYERGKPVGYEKEFYQNGKLKEIDFIKDNQVVYFEEFDSAGSLIKDFRGIEISSIDTLYLGDVYYASIKTGS